MALEILSTEDYARLTRRKPQSIRRERMRGDGPPFFRIGRRVFYRATDIEAWTAERIVQSTAEETVRSQLGTAW
jgi:hypothetical protein